MGHAVEVVASKAQPGGAEAPPQSHHSSQAAPAAESPPCLVRALRGGKREEPTLTWLSGVM